MDNKKPTGQIAIGTIAGVLATAIITISQWVYGWMPAAWTWFTSTLSAIGAYIVSPATVPTWWLYLLTLCGAWFALYIVILGAQKLRPNKPNVPPEPTHIEYRKDFLYGSTWRWRYLSGSLIDLTPYCPTCDTVLVYSHQDFYMNDTTLHCETCRCDVTTSQNTNFQGLKQMVARQIDRKIRSNEWKNYIEPKAPTA